MPPPDLIEAKRVRVTYVCPSESKLKGMNMEVEVEASIVATVDSVDPEIANAVAEVTCPLCSSFHEVLL